MKEVLISVEPTGKTYKGSYGDSLRALLKQNGLYSNEGISCGGNGICGTCSLEVYERNEWVEKPSCQVRCFRNLRIQLIY